MDSIEVQWLSDEPSLEEALRSMLNCSGQLLKRHLTKKELSRRLRARDLSRLPLDLVNNLRINPVYEGAPCRILHETADYIAIHKPPGIHSHPLRYGDKDTVLNALAMQGKLEALEIHPEAYDRGLLYRLDQETSGVLLLAKNEALFQTVRGEFATAMKRKLYWAVVAGSFDKEGEWRHRLAPFGPKGAKQRVDDSGTEGVLTVKKLLEKDGRTLVLVSLKTGLRHQIRAQLASLGFPLLGDELYGGSRAPRLFLHAWRYEWNEVVEDNDPELFGGLFDLDRALEVSHDVLRSLKG